jgi:MazG family protein
LPLGDELERLQLLTERLRRECPWDREQTVRTIVPHTVEEAYEVADAAIEGSPEKLLDELGDLLFQVYFLSLLLAEQGQGDLAEVARTVHDKLVRRHPHVFGETEAATAGRVKENWERIKTEQEGREGVFHDVPEALPALLHARKVQRRAATSPGRSRSWRRSSRSSASSSSAPASRLPRRSPMRACSTSSVTCSSPW